MNAFEYLAVLLSIVIGLGMTNVLSGFASMVRHRDRVKIYWPLLVWMAVILLTHVQLWWALFELRKVPVWNFGAFLAVLMQPVALYLTTAVLVPDFPDKGEIDLKAAYYRETRWFFGGIVMLVIVSLIRPVVISGYLTNPTDLTAQLVFITLAGVAAITRNEIFHKVNTFVGMGLYLTYIVLLFVQLS